MHSFSNRTIVLVLALLIYLIGAGPAAAVVQSIPVPGIDKSDTKTPDSGTAPANPLRPVNTEGIDDAGEKIGKGIEKFSDHAAKYLGDWIKQDTLGGIALIKLLSCFLLLLGVMVIERLLRWGIRRKIDAIPHQEGVISWLRLLLKAVVKPLSLFIYVYGIYAALSPLYGHFEGTDSTNLVLTVVKRTADIGGTVALFWFFYQLVALFDARIMTWADGTESSIDNMLVPLIGKTLRVFIVVVGGMMVLQNLRGLKSVHCWPP